MEYHYFLGICLLVTSARTEESINQLDSFKSSRQNENLNFIQEFLVNTSTSVKNKDYTALYNKNGETGLDITYETQDGKLNELGTLKDNDTIKTHIQVIPVPSVVSSAIDTLPVHPRIPRRSLTRRKTKVRSNRQNKRRGYFAQPARILLPPYRQKEHLNPEITRMPVVPAENSDRNYEEMTDIEQSTKVVPITATPITFNSNSEIQEVTAVSNESEKKNVSPQIHKMFIAPPQRFLLPPLSYENYVNAQSSTSPSFNTEDKIKDPSNTESELSDTFNIESRPVSRLPILIIEDDSSEYQEPESNFKYSTPNPLKRFQNRDVELINNLQSSNFKNRLLISVTTEITPVYTKHTSFANFDKYDEHNPAYVNHSLETGGNTQPVTQDNNQNNFSIQQQPAQYHQQPSLENQPFVVPHQNNQNHPELVSNREPSNSHQLQNQFVPANENLFNLNPNSFNTNMVQNNQHLQQSQEFSLSSLPQQIVHINHQNKDMKQLNSPLRNQPNVFSENPLPNTNMHQNILNNERESDFHVKNHPPLISEFEKTQDNVPINSFPDNVFFNQQQQLSNVHQQLPSQNIKLPEINHMKPYTQSENEPQSNVRDDQSLHSGGGHEHQIFPNQPQQTAAIQSDHNLNNHQQQESQDENQNVFSSSNRNQDLPLNYQSLSLVLQPPLEDSFSLQVNHIINPLSTQQTFSPSNQQQNNGKNVTPTFFDNIDTQLGFHTNQNLPQQIAGRHTFPMINDSANVESTHFEYNSTKASTSVPHFPSTPALFPGLRGPNIEQALFETGDFQIFENTSNESLDPMLAMMDKPLLTNDVFETGMKIMVMNKQKLNKMKVNRGNIKYKHLNQFNLFNDRGFSTDGKANPPVLVVAETSYYNIPQGAVELYHDSEIRVIPGRPGRDYPTLNEPPASSDFSCRSVKQHRGYVADPATRCQVFYICVGAGPGEPMLCPNGTLFSQDYLVCDWWYNIDCQSYP